MKKGAHIGLSLSLLFGNSTSRVLRSWYWHPVWLELDGKNFQQMWTTCERGDWLLWFCTHMIGQPGWPTHQQIVLASCQCARLSLRHIKPSQGRPLTAIETAEAWARGEAITELVLQAGRAANYLDHDNTAYCAAQAAHSAAWAVYVEEDGSCFRLAQAASAAASWMASAASYELFTAELEARDYTPATDIARNKVKKVTLHQCADLVRRLLKVPESLTTEFAALQQPVKKPATRTTENDYQWQKGYKALE
jgi:hypothetical protein